MGSSCPLAKSCKCETSLFGSNPAAINLRPYPFGPVPLPPQSARASYSSHQDRHLPANKLCLCPRLPNPDSRLLYLSTYRRIPPSSASHVPPSKLSQR